jgi:methyl-accepting chemotaxis protein
MTQLETLSGMPGRALLREIYRELRFERQLSSSATLATMWQICTRERELFRLTKRNVMVLHPLGIWTGSSLWMQEVVNRYYFSTINAFVYAGAALLLVFVGFYRFRVLEEPTLVVAAIGIEALLLVVLFLVMFFTPPDDIEGGGSGGDASSSATEELLREIGEIGRDYAAMAVQLETISSMLGDLVERQDALITSVRDGVDAAVSAVAPNPQLMNSMQRTTESLDRFAGSIDVLTDRLRTVEREEVERLVRSELERILSRSIVQRDEPPTTPPPTR